MRATIVALAAALAACQGGGRVSLSTTVPQEGGGAAVGPAVSAALALGDRVTLERARILVRKVALESEGPEGSGEMEEPESGEVVVRWGPLVIDLSGTDLDGGVVLLFDELVPTGTYDELTFQIHKLTPGESVDDADFTPLGPSILLDLTVDGEPTTFATDLTAVAEIEGPFTVAEGEGVNVTVTIDPSGWFVGPGGSFLDPRIGENRRRIEQNLRASIHGFEDDDRDGAPDDG